MFRLHLQGICTSGKRAISQSVNTFKPAGCAHTAETLLLEKAVPEDNTVILADLSCAALLKSPYSGVMHRSSRAHQRYTVQTVMKESNGPFLCAIGVGAILNNAQYSPASLSR